MGDVRQDFDDAFEVQRAQSNRLAGVERSTENFDEIVAERATLEGLRAETRSAKARIVSRFEPPAPDHVEQPLGRQDTSRSGKIGVALGSALVVFALGVVWFGVIEPLRDPYPITIDSVTNERVDVDAPCLWSFDIAMTNGFEEPLAIERVELVMNRRRVSGIVEPMAPIPPGSSGVVTASFRAGTANQCPTVDEIDHGTLSVTTDPYGFVDARF